ncbi:energy transducer TonB [Ferrovum myxofaciens]|uniref:Energy transducer TonB n=1 Tax=Ferrovum myxofaciens TaxID=416213 RepID=A0A9E6N051_9PROT|nr:energy transducer TonB [Ferrovum myxofaciens]MBU6993775.1 energy transducer TonB [Ferrovum myxofaciens]QKE37829.1 MAG: energy transducer TonB [Ferrovum myxofaciens]QKE40461.1 MAG: hypothetical protein HO274_03360 [Ferrovum myxofaciens]QWY75502.1 MAG: energy transducer TonB [Ferrovum myxofaciens]QWY78240.1 MAG: energy transducer TonB [Ferrovum myxofaciens]
MMNLLRAFILASLLEGLMILTFLYGLHHEVDKVVKPPVTLIQLTQAPEAPKTVPPPPTPKPPPPKPVVHRTVAHQEPTPVPTPTPAPAPPPVVPTPVIPAPVTPPQKVAEATPVRPQHLRPADISITFADKVRSAVQNAVVFPMAARAAHLSGQTKVTFDYKDGMASGASVLITSGNRILDKAALTAVHVAHFPEATAEYAGRVLTFEIWVKFLGLDEHE